MSRIISRCLQLLGLLACLSAVLPITAQDRRHVTEPTIPPVCTKLAAIRQATPDGEFPAGESNLDTARIQAALDHCSAGHAVELARGAAGAMAFLSAPLSLRERVTLLVDKGVTLYASRNPADYEAPHADGSPILCGTSIPRPGSIPTFSVNQAARPKGGCRPFLAAENVKNAGIMGEGTLDGRGYAKLVGHDYSWWQMARRAQPHDDLYFSVKFISADHADGFILSGVHIHNTMNFHVVVNHTNGFTAWGVHLQTPTNKALIGTDNDARNTDGIDPGTSENITVAHSWIDNGDDNIAVKQGVSHMSVLDNHFYSGHGMSIGSETVLGQSFLLVDGLTEDHTTSGIRIKSNVLRGGPVHDLTYRNICMRDVPIPIAISPYYTNQTVEPFEDPKYKGDRIPDYKRITLQNVLSETPGDVLIAGLNDQHRTQVTLMGVQINGIRPDQMHLAYADIFETNDSVNLPLAQARHIEGVSLSSGGVAVERPDGTVVNPAPPFSCAGKFVPYR